MGLARSSAINCVQRRVADFRRAQAFGQQPTDTDPGQPVGDIAPLHQINRGVEHQDASFLGNQGTNALVLR
jgi:hypothetical protein